MKLRRALHLVGAGALTGALLLGTAPPASADDIRDRQWALDAFAAEEIWQHATGKGVVVAVVDSGVDASHPDLTGQVLKGRDFTGRGTSAREDTDGHGTAMAGLIAGHGHGPGANAGVMGLAPDAKILPIRFTHSDSELGVSWAEGVRFAVDNGADVINISRGTTRNFQEKEAVEYAIKHDVVVVASTGNEGVKKASYPAAYPGVVAVGGMDDSGSVWKNSSWGSNTTLIAPATNNVVTNTNYESGYAVANGTSDAAAYVSASAALVIEEHPDLTAGQVINRLIATAKIPAGENANPALPDEKFGYGVIRPLRAVTEDIPAGPEAGPLAQSSEEDASAVGGADESQAAPGDDSAAEESGGFGGVLIGVIVVVALGVVGLVAFLVFKGKQKKQPPYAGAPGGGPANGWSGVPPQQYGQQPPQGGQYYGSPGSPPPPAQPPSPR